MAEVAFDALLALLRKKEKRQEKALENTRKQIYDIEKVQKQLADKRR